PSGRAGARPTRALQQYCPGERRGLPLDRLFLAVGTQGSCSVTHRSSLRKALISIGALIVLAGCASGGGSSGNSPAAGGPVHGGDLVIARTAASQSLHSTTLFDNESIWIFQQIYQTLYTGTNYGKHVKPQLAPGYKGSPSTKP